MSTDERSRSGRGEGEPIGVNLRRLFITVLIMLGGCILLLMAIRYVFL